MAKKTIKKKEENNKEKFYSAEEQGILPEETPEEKVVKMRQGEEDEDIYGSEGREQQEEDAEIENWEEGFMEGASQAGQLAKDALTGKPLMGAEDIVETEIEGKIYRFANEENARKFRKKKKQEKNK